MIDKLIAELEVAAGPDRELDAGIWEHLGLAPKHDNSKNNYGHWHYRGAGIITIQTIVLGGVINYRHSTPHPLTRL